MIRRFFKFSLFLCLFFPVQEILAQEVLARLDLGRRDAKPDFYEYSPTDEGMVTLGPSSLHSNRYLSLKKYDKELNEEWTNKVLEQNGRKQVDFVSVIGQTILVFVSEQFVKEGVIKTYYNAYDLAGTEIISKAILSVYPNEKEQKVDLQFIHSPNKRKLLCYKNLQNKRDAETILYYIFEQDGSYVQNGEMELKYPDNRFRVRNLRVSNQGNIYVLGKFYRNTRVKDTEDFKYLIYRYDSEREQGAEIEVELGDRYITDLAFRLDRVENIYVAGFYSNRSTNQIAGTVLQKINPQGELVLNTSEAFDEEFLGNYLSDIQISRGRELRNFYMDPEQGIILRSDGGVLLLAEKFYVTYQSYQDIYGYWTDRELYHYEDVILTSVGQDGHIEWHAIVDKNQVSDNPSNLSYFNAVASTGSFIFYEYRPRREGINIYYNSVGINGEVSDRVALIPDYRYGNEFYPRFCEQVNNHEAFMVYMQNRGKMLSVVKVRID